MSELSVEAIQVLQQGRRNVLQGWCQHLLVDGAGNHCAFGALRPGDADAVAVKEALHALEDELGLEHAKGMATVAIAAWNDAPERTQADVVALFDRVLTNQRSRVGVAQ